jgi:hypothetical protein
MERMIERDPYYLSIVPADEQWQRHLSSVALVCVCFDFSIKCAAFKYVDRIV